MILVNKNGAEIKTGDIVWYEKQSCVFLSYDPPYVKVETTCDRRLYMRLFPKQLKLETQEAL